MPAISCITHNAPGLAADAAFLLVFFGAPPCMFLLKGKEPVGDPKSVLLVKLPVRCLLGLALLGLAGLGDGDLKLRGADVGLTACTNGTSSSGGRRLPAC